MRIEFIKGCKRGYNQYGIKFSYIKFTIILHAHPDMNILSFEQMEKTEIQLLKIKSEQKFMLKLPTSEELTNIHLFQSKLFPFANSKITDAIHKKVRFTDSLRTSAVQNQNTLFRMLTFHLLNTLFTEKQHEDSDKINENKVFLLKRIKCTLYSKETDFTYIRNCPFEVNNIQMKVLGANFFQYMQELSSNFNVYCFRCAEWLLENNPLLVELFTLLLRVILFYSKIPKAGNYKFYVDPHKSIVGLLDFFDLQYQYSDNMFLQFQDGLLIAIIEGGLITGEYYQNEGEQQNSKRRYEIKKEVRMNLIESLVVTVNEEQTQSSRQMKISKDDAKLFQLLLHSENNNRQSESIYVHDDDDVADENEQHVTTPQFKQKKQGGQFVKNQKIFKFSDLILNESINNQFTEPDSLQSKANMFNQSSFKPNNIFESNELQLNGWQQSNILDHSLSQNKLLRNQSNFSINLEPKFEIIIYRQGFPPLFTPHKISKVLIGNMRLSEFRANKKNISGEKKLIQITVKRPDYSQILNCECHSKKMIRNNFDKKVIDVFFNPTNKHPHRKVQMQRNMPTNKVEGIKSISDLSRLSSCGQSSIDMQKDSNHYQINIQQERKPAFLKNLKNTKRGQNQAKILLNGTKSSQVLRNASGNEQCSHQRLSEMVPHLRPIQQGNSKSTTRDESIYQHMKLPKKPIRQHHNQYSIIPCGRSSLDDPFSPWRTNDTGQPRASHYSNANNLKDYRGIEHLPTPTSTKMQLISPNYLNVPKQTNCTNQNFKSYYQNLDYPNPERKKAESNEQIPPIIFKDQTPGLKVHKSQKVLTCYAKKYQK